METGLESLFLSQENIDAFKYSPADGFVVCCEKFNANFPDNTNLRIIEAATGRAAAQFVWSRPAKESLKTFMWSPDESICLRMVQSEGPGQPNSIEVYRDSDFSQPAARIFARFPRKPKNKKEAPTFVTGKFDGFELCPLNVLVSPSESP